MAKNCTMPRPDVVFNNPGDDAKRTLLALYIMTTPYVIQYQFTWAQTLTQSSFTHFLKAEPMPWSRSVDEFVEYFANPENPSYEPIIATAARVGRIANEACVVIRQCHERPDSALYSSFQIKSLIASLKEVTAPLPADVLQNSEYAQTYDWT